MAACASFQEKNSTLHQNLAADETQEAISQLSAKICEAKAALHRAEKRRSDSQKELEAIHEGNKRLRASCEGMAKFLIHSAKALACLSRCSYICSSLRAHHVVICWPCCA